MVGVLGGERNGICEFEQINIKMEFSLVHFVLLWMVHSLNKFDLWKFKLLK